MGEQLEGQICSVSFSQFSVPTGGVAFFNNAAAIQNIISRVTGGSVSNIDGLLRANGTANLFLINPNGIIFGRNATLTIGGSFVASTASSLKFADGTQFSATAPQTTPLLTISVPLGLQFGANPGSIGVQGDGQGIRTTSEPIDTTAGLHVQSNQTLALVGGDVNLEGGTLKTAGGRIELGSVAGPGLVSLTPIDKGWALGYSGVPAFRNINLSQQAAVDASGLGGGDIQVQGKRVTLQDGSQIESSPLGSLPGGTLSVTASDSVELIGTSANGQFYSGLSTEVYPEATGAGGNLTLETGRLIVRDGAQVNTYTFGAGPAGNLAVKADSVELMGISEVTEFVSGLFTEVSPTGTGAGGNLTLETGQLIVRDGAQVSAGTLGEGNAGNLNVTASSVELIGTAAANSQYPSGLFTSAYPDSRGAGGNLTLETGRLIVRDGAQVNAYTAGAGRAGNLAVRANESVELMGKSADGQSPSSLTARSTGAGTAGNLSIATGKLMVSDGGQVTVTTSGAGNAGNLTVNATGLVTISGTNSGLFANTATGSTGDGGSIFINPSQLTLTDGASIAVNSQGTGNGGDLLVQTGSLTLDNGASLLAATTNSEGGNVSLNVQDLLQIRHNSQISATANPGSGPPGSRQGYGSNLSFITKFLIASDHSQIISGSIGFSAQGVFISPDSSIIASGEQLQLPSQNSVIDVSALPTSLVDASRLIAPSCPAYAQAQPKKIVVTPLPDANSSAQSTNRNTDPNRTDADTDPIAALL